MDKPEDLNSLRLLFLLRCNRTVGPKLMLKFTVLAGNIFKFSSVIYVVNP